MSRDAETRFWEKVDRGDPDECWEWQAGSQGEGYGRFWYNGRAENAHRVAYEFATGEPPTEHVLHHCDNRACVNPDHLSENDGVDNNRNTVKRGRVVQGKDVETRFWEKVDRGDPDECWEWQAAAHEDGYGRFWHNNRADLSHRVVYELTHGEIPEDEQINHHCDNPPCVNPNHLYAGTQFENVRDIFERTNPDAGWLTDQDVREIRERYISPKELAGEYGVSESYVRRILRGDQR